jgi:flagellar biosynthesis/type III secretory pathway ATPase
MVTERDMPTPFSALEAELDRITSYRRIGRVAAVSEAALELTGLTHQARIGDGVAIDASAGAVSGEVVAVAERYVRAMTYGPSDGISVGARVLLERREGIHPGRHWIGRIVDAFGRPLDGRPLAPGAATAPLRRTPPDPAARRPLGAGWQPASRSSIPSFPSPAASASESSRARASASRRCSQTSPAASRPTPSCSA